MGTFFIKIPHKSLIQEENYNHHLIQLRFPNRPPAYVSMTSREQQQIRREKNVWCQLLSTSGHLSAIAFKASAESKHRENLPTSASHLCLQITSMALYRENILSSLKCLLDANFYITSTSRVVGWLVSRHCSHGKEFSRISETKQGLRNIRIIL